MRAIDHYRAALALVETRDFAEAQVHATLFAGILEYGGYEYDPEKAEEGIRQAWDRGPWGFLEPITPPGDAPSP